MLYFSNLVGFGGGYFSNLVGFGAVILVIWSVLVRFFHLQHIENQSFAIKKTRSYKIFCKDILTRKGNFREKRPCFCPKNWNNREKERTLPLGSEEGFFRATFPAC